MKRTRFIHCNPILQVDIMFLHIQMCMETWTVYGILTTLNYLLLKCNAQKNAPPPFNKCLCFQPTESQRCQCIVIDAGLSVNVCVGWSEHQYHGMRYLCQWRNSTASICFCWIQWCCSCSRSGIPGTSVRLRVGIYFLAIYDTFASN